MRGKSKPTGDSGQPGTTRCWEPGRGAGGGVNGKLCLCLAAASLGPQQGSCEDCGPPVVQEGGELEDLDVECGEQRHVRTFRDAMHVTISNYKDLQRGTGCLRLFSQSCTDSSRPTLLTYIQGTGHWEL